MSQLFQDPVIKLHPNYNFKILGSYNGDDKFVQNKVHEKVADVDAMIKAAASLDDTQSAMLLISNCFDSCRMNYIMRTIDPNIISNALMKFDEGLRNGIEVQMGRRLSDVDLLILHSASRMVDTASVHHTNILMLLI